MKGRMGGREDGREMGICEVVGDGQLSYLLSSLLSSPLQPIIGSFFYLKLISFRAAPARCVDDERSEDEGIPFFALLAVSEVRMDSLRPTTDGRVPKGREGGSLTL